MEKLRYCLLYADIFKRLYPIRIFYVRDSTHILWIVIILMFSYLLPSLVALNNNLRYQASFYLEMITFLVKK